MTHKYLITLRAQPMGRVHVKQTEDQVFSISVHRFVLRPLYVVGVDVLHKILYSFPREGGHADQELIEDYTHGPPGGWCCRNLNTRVSDRGDYIKRMIDRCFILT